MAELGIEARCSTMGWENRGSGRYYYRKRRIGGRVVSVYIGPGERGKEAAARDRAARDAREHESRCAREEREKIAALAGAGVEAEQGIRALVRAFLLLAGYHTHGGQWRRRRAS